MWLHWVDTPPPPRGTLLLKFDTHRALELLRSQPKRHYVYPKSLKCNISISNRSIALKFNKVFEAT